MTLGALVFLYLFHNKSFYFVRNMFMVAMGIALVGYTVFPTAPPRFFPEWGFLDSVSDFTGVSHDSVVANALFNPYAAVPSMHVCFALMIGVPLARLSKHRVTRIAWGLYPLLVTFVIVATGNHFLADAILGAVTAGLSAWAASWLARARPTAWAFSTAQGLMATPGADAPATAPGARRAPRRDAQPADRVAPDAERDLAHRLRPQRRGGRARLAGALHLGRHRVHRRLGMRHARRALLAHVGQGHAVRRLPGLDARPHRGGHRAHRGGLRLRQATATRSPPRRSSLAVLASLMVSYTRARAEALGVECKVGIASRAVRVVILSVGIVFADLDLLAPAVYVLAGLGTITVLQRILHVRKELNRLAQPASDL